MLWIVWPLFYPLNQRVCFFVGWKSNKQQRRSIFQESVDEVEKEDKKKVVVSGAATGEEDAFPKVVFNSNDGNWAVCSELSLQEAVKSFHEKPLPTHEKTALNKYDHILSQKIWLNMTSLSAGPASSSSQGNRHPALELPKTKHHIYCIFETCPLFSFAYM